MSEVTRRPIECAQPGWERDAIYVDGQLIGYVTTDPDGSRRSCDPHWYQVGDDTNSWDEAVDQLVENADRGAWCRAGRRPAVTAAPCVPSRIDIAVTRDMLAAIDQVIDTDDVTLTEAVRRLLAYGHVIHQTLQDGGTVRVRDADGRDWEVTPGH